MFTKLLTITNDDHITKSAKTNETKAQWFDAILISCRIFYHCCKHFKMSNIENSEYQIIYNYVCRREYPRKFGPGGGGQIFWGGDIFPVTPALLILFK